MNQEALGKDKLSLNRRKSINGKIHTMITVEPLFGLANRMSMLDDALSLAEQCRMPVRLIWNRNMDLNCRFDELFQIPAEIRDLLQPRRCYHKRYAGPMLSLGTPEFHRDARLKNIRALQFLLTGLKKQNMHCSKGRIIYVLRHINKLIFSHRKYERVLYLDEIRQLAREGFDFTVLSRHRSIYLQGCIRFLNSPPALDRFRPVDEINRVIEEVTSSFSPPTIGIHIRRTDHAISVTESPTSQFVSEMKKEIERNPEAMFFLATDSPEEERRLKSFFPGRNVTYKKSSRDRNDPRAIKDALVDLYCLSRTSKILASLGSSFSRVAAELGRIPFQLILKEGKD